MTQLTITDHGAVRLITIANPPRGYMDAQTAVELVEALKAAESDDGVRVLVFTGGVSGVFIRHYDVSEIVDLAEAARAGAVRPGGRRSASPVYDLFDRMIAYPKPTIAAINGICMGGGCEFALTCDIRVAASSDYSIGLPETRLGITPGVGGLQLLARIVGLPRAQEMAMLGRVVGPEEAERIGLVHALSGDAVATALTLASDLARRPPHAVVSVKRMAHKIAAGESLEAGMTTSSEEFLKVVIDDSALERMRSFLDGGEDILAD